MDAHSKGLVLGFGLVMLCIILAVIVKQLQSGSRAFSHLEKTIEISLDSINLDFFLQGYRRRLASLGFQPFGEPDEFIQGGRGFGDLGTIAHARTKKSFILRWRESSADKVIASLTLRYQNLVVADTGESAYRDAVLDFVSGKSDEMKTVTNESLLALNSLIGGIVAGILTLVMVMSGQLGLWMAIPGIGVTELAAGLLALLSIQQKPTEITGRWKAIAGILLSLAAIGTSLYFIITTRSGPPGG